MKTKEEWKKEIKENHEVGGYVATFTINALIDKIYEDFEKNRKYSKEEIESWNGMGT